jgi:hypothetical protein
MTLKIFVNLTMTLKIFINLIITLKMLMNFIGNIFYAQKRNIIVSLVLHDISCITVKVRPFLNENEVPSIKLGHVIHLLSVHFFTDGDDS